MNAKEAKKLTKESKKKIKPTSNYEIPNEILREIETASHNGKSHIDFEITNYVDIDIPSLVKSLKKLGYRARHHHTEDFDYEGPGEGPRDFIEIKW